MVVDDVEERPRCPGRAPHSPVGGGRRACRNTGQGEQVDTVITPVPDPGEVGDRHQFDRGDAQVRELRQLSCRRGERPFGRERADVQLVEDEVVPRNTRPALSVQTNPRGSTISEGP